MDIKQLFLQQDPLVSGTLPNGIRYALCCDPIPNATHEPGELRREIAEAVASTLELVEYNLLSEHHLVKALEAAHRRIVSDHAGLASALLVAESESNGPDLLVAGVGDLRLYGAMGDSVELTFCDPYHLDQVGLTSTQERRNTLRNVLGSEEKLDIYCRKLARANYRMLIPLTYGAYSQVSDQAWSAVGSSEGVEEWLKRELSAEGHHPASGWIIDLSRKPQSRPTPTPVAPPPLFQKRRKLTVSRAVNVLIVVGLVVLTVSVWHAIGERGKGGAIAEATSQPIELSAPMVASLPTPVVHQETSIDPQEKLFAAAYSELEEMLFEVDPAEVATVAQGVEVVAEWRNVVDAYNTLQVAYEQLRERHTAQTERLIDTSAELERLRERVDWEESLEGSVREITSREEELQQKFAEAKETRDRLRQELDDAIVAHAREEVELQLGRERIADLERSLAAESARRFELEKRLEGLHQAMAAYGGDFEQVKGVIAQANHSLQEKEIALQVQEGELSSLSQAHQELRNQFAAISNLAEERANALAFEMERRQAVEEALRGEKSQRVQLEQTVASREEQQKMLAQLQRTQEELTHQIEGLSRTSEALQQEKTILEREVGDLVKIAQAKERSLQEVREQASTLAEEHGTLAKSMSQLVAEKGELAEQARAERDRRMRGEALYNQIASSLREQQQIIAEMEESRNELRRELDQIRKEQAHLRKGGNLSEMPELSFDASTRLESPPPRVAQPKPAPKPAVAKPAPKGDNTQLHFVKSGESLSQISQRYYGTTNRWGEIADANAHLIADVNKIPVGTPLVIP